MVGKAREGVTPPGPAPDTPPKPPAHQEFGGTTGLGQALPSPCPIHTVHPDGAPASHPALVLRGDLTLGLQEPDRLDVSSALHRVRQPEQGDVHAQTGVDVAGKDDNTAHVQQPPAPGEIHVPRMDAVGCGVGILPGVKKKPQRWVLLGQPSGHRGDGLGNSRENPPVSPDFIPPDSPPRPTQSWAAGEKAVGGGQHPLGGDEGAPTDVLPGGPVVIVDSQPDLPRPPPLGGTVAPHDTGQLPLRDGCWGDNVQGTGTWPCRPAEPEILGRSRLGQRAGWPEGRSGVPGRGTLCRARTHPGSQRARSPPGGRGSGAAATASAGRRGTATVRRPGQDPRVWEASLRGLTVNRLPHCDGHTASLPGPPWESFYLSFQGSGCGLVRLSSPPGWGHGAKLGCTSSPVHPPLGPEQLPGETQRTSWMACPDPHVPVGAIV
ncbi:uncharacterized protein LOC123783750 isoform X2 [Ursus americanus]|uniref:uncharacterized protein LOC123783750 isoform X2 n=1 Tax=Ursus americanus TaxID=9643 RepID=UPI001E67DF41|nr:uncharacterized protein LOC123783750 isoform X2 [Ursus americanus]